MLYNRNKTWTSEDIQLLDWMLKKHMSYDFIMKKLGRSKRAIDHAIKNNVFQQLVHKDLDAVEKHYDIDSDCLKYGIVPYKYYTDQYEEEAYEEEPYEEEPYEEEPSPTKETFGSQFTKGLLFGFVFMVACGTKIYLDKLNENWTLLSVNGI